MKIKTKLTLGVGLLFILIILLSIVGAFNINALKSDTENILKANYNSLLYSRNILSVLNNPSEKTIQVIEDNLKKQENNATEIGELEANLELRNNFEAYKKSNSNSSVQLAIQENLFQIMDMNMQAIQRKSEVAKTTADKAVFWIVVTGTICFLIAFILLVNLPSNIANPIKELTESIKQIAAKNYSKRVHFESHSEFGELAKSFNSKHDPVIGLDENLKVIFANEEALKIIGSTAIEIIGHFTQELALKNDLVRNLITDLMIENPILGQKQAPVKIFAENKESYFEKETLHISIVPTGEKDSILVGHVIFLRNVTSYKELDFAKTNFIATVSHELKTPISSIKLSLQLLENAEIGHLNDEQKNLVESIKDDATRLLKITGELLNMTQVESGNIQLSIMPADPKEILLYAINATQTQADQKQIKFNIECPDSISKVQADNEKTAWVLTNLISNAIRYSYDNSTIYLSIIETKNNVQISVRDRGQGIAPQYKDKVFDRYFRVPGTKKEGTGLGLSISKEFIEAQGGQISVETEFGAGSKFSITLNTLT
ncbi:MAG: HAMP domain-containing protein [Saprospiraceae bacterium]|nr:ATP-binding protein [Candidatus Brachybacter algidus]MBL0120576.1 HAMP domain-containing protein [Candidatus Brachybacter algidus]